MMSPNLAESTLTAWGRLIFGKAGFSQVILCRIAGWRPAIGRYSSPFKRSPRMEGAAQRSGRHQAFASLRAIGCSGHANYGYSIGQAVALAVLLLASFVAFGQEAEMKRGYVGRHKPAQQPSVGCGDFNYGSLSIGPLDYRITPQDVRELVERRHFTASVERLQQGVTSSVAGDINYTLRAFPNHPRALKSAAELTRRNGGLKPDRLKYTIACWFDRAIAFRPDDVQVRILWAFELLKSKEKPAALEQTRIAESLANGDPAVHYNVGLLYFELGDAERAMSNAKIAYAGGFELPGLRQKLTKAGQWKE